MLQADYARGTRDSDVFETDLLTPAIKRTLLSLGGPGTDLHTVQPIAVEPVAAAASFAADLHASQPQA